MTDKIEDGGHAFPYNVVEIKSDGSWVATPHYGMTLRDWFAGQALAGTCAIPNLGLTTEEIAHGCYFLADAMLAARKAKP